MTETDIRIGEKVRALRLSRGMTQKQLAGGQITRSMLSLIESGDASPSLGTLLYLADRLDVPAGYFFLTTADEENHFKKGSVIGALHDAFRDGEYESCIRICDEFPVDSLDDELAFLLAVSCLYKSVSEAGYFSMKEARSWLDKAEDVSGRSVYCRDSFRSAIRYYRLLYGSVCVYPSPAGLADENCAGDYVPADMISYFAALSNETYRDSGAACVAPSTHEGRHLHALQMIEDGSTAEAAKRLRELSLDPELPFYMHYPVLCDLEKAANALEDLRLAYSASRRKLELMKKCQV